MKGKILDYSVQSNSGVISGNDGVRYKFGGAEWKAQTPPAVGQDVDFDVNEQEALGVYLISSSESKSKVAAALLAFFLGGFGAHKFYLGRTVPAVIMLLVWFFGWILFGIPTLVISIIAFIEFIIYITKSDADFQRIYVDGKRGWF
jgi:TM2 domain-containing membrane protein YozV